MTDPLNSCDRHEPIYVGAPCRGAWASTTAGSCWAWWSCQCGATRPEDCKAETADVVDAQRMATQDPMRHPTAETAMQLAAEIDRLRADATCSANTIDSLYAEIDRLQAALAELVKAADEFCEAVRVETHGSMGRLSKHPYDKLRSATAKAGAK